ncbi:MAG: hypothetical protein WAT79_09650 [Saprospiraceae bacterium]
MMNWMSTYFLPIVMMTFVLSMRDCCSERDTYPSFAGDWTEECTFFTPFPVQYEAVFRVLSENVEGGFDVVPNAKVTCRVIGYHRLLHPTVPDTCYWSIFTEKTLTGFSDAEGIFTAYYNFTYGSVADYFILEVLTEKNGYSRDLFSSDKRWHDYEKRVRSSDNSGMLPGYRELFYSPEIKVQNENP